jgi:hypothetical protein
MLPDSCATTAFHTSKGIDHMAGSKQPDMKASVIPTMMADGSLRIEMTTDEYSGWTEFFEKGGMKIANRAVAEGIRLGLFTDIRLSNFYNLPADTKDVEYFVTRSDGTDLVDDREDGFELAGADLSKVFNQPVH